MVILSMVLAGLGGRATTAQQDKYALQVPNGLAFSDFRSYENWQVVAVSQTDDLLKVSRQSHDDRRLSVRRSRQRQAFPRRLQDRKNRVETEKEQGGPFFGENTGHLTR